MTRPPAYLAPHLRTATDVHAVAPPFVQPNNYYQPPYSHGHTQQRPYHLPTQSQTAISSESALVEVQQASAPPARYYDARRHYHDSRFQPYPRPSPRFLDENAQDPSAHILLQGSSTRHQQAGGDARQAHTFEQHDIELRGCDGRLFASPQPNHDASFQVGTVDRSLASTFAGNVIHAQSLNPVVDDPARFAPPHGASHFPDRRASTRVDDGAPQSASYLVAAYPQMYGHSMRPSTASHPGRARPAPTTPSVTAANAFYGVDEAVDAGLGCTPTNPVPAPTPSRLSTIQQQAYPAPPADRPSSARRLQWILAEPDDLHATAYYRLSIDSKHEISPQKEQIPVHDTDILASKQATLGRPDAKFYPHLAHVPHFTAPRAQECNLDSLGGNSDPRPVSSMDSGRQHENSLAAQALAASDRQDLYHRLPRDAIPAQRPPARNSALWAAQASVPRVDSARYPAQSSHYQGATLPPQSMIVHDGSGVACPATLKLSCASAAGQLHNQEYDNTEGPMRYLVPVHGPPMDGSSPYPRSQGAFIQWPDVQRLWEVCHDSDVSQISPHSQISINP
ncbi:hypothetical protein TRAPUB_3098 [Trametes pubescens]|uniref:Uncharacterized protein n=1 Tax=Trametes pubescens TaxID=154538 RepID=A0A1M2VEN5_TRAPU|nr:hypothetical protein TRAPUB_3098 [Trametes pubescens]